MLLEKLLPVLERINGCTFASLDAETNERGLVRVVSNEQIILFTNKKSNGYENMVRRRLQEAGLDPDSFILRNLPWGERIEGTPLIKHKGFYYLQTILLREGEVRWYMPGNPPRKEVPDNLLPAFLGKSYSRMTNRLGLPENKTVKVQTYALENIKALRLKGERLGGKLKIK